MILAIRYVKIRPFSIIHSLFEILCRIFVELVTKPCALSSVFYMLVHHCIALTFDVEIEV